MDNLSWVDFTKLDIRVGTIVDIKDFKEALKPAYQIWIDFGLLGVKKSSAQITFHYKKEELIGYQVIAIINFTPKKIANFFSECLILGIYDENNNVVLIKPDKKVGNGLKIG